MGVDYFSCSGCQEIICDAGEFYICESCSSYFCADCFCKLENDGFKDSENGLDACWFCTNKRELRRVNNEEFIEWLLEVSGKSREDYLNYLAGKGEFDILTEEEDDDDSGGDYQIDEEKVINLAHAIKKYFIRDNPTNSKFYDNPDDCYDGISLGSERVFEFIVSVIESGKYEKFLANPFDGDIMKHLRRDVSCGNSSCLYLIPLVPVTYQEPSVELLNKIFDIIRMH